MNDKLYYWVAIFASIASVLCWFVLNPIHKANLQKIDKPPLLTCIYCQGTGERVEDVNRIIFLAKTQLYLNKHLAIDKCQNCVKLENGDCYIYCDEAEQQYQIFLKEYGAAGPKMEKTSCGECMGMGQFSSFDIKTQKYLTQKEYEQRERDKVNN